MPGVVVFQGLGSLCGLCFEREKRAGRLGAARAPGSRAAPRPSAPAEVAGPASGPSFPHDPRWRPGWISATWSSLRRLATRRSRCRSPFTPASRTTTAPRRTRTAWATRSSRRGSGSARRPSSSSAPRISLSLPGPESAAGVPRRACRVCGLRRGSRDPIPGLPGLWVRVELGPRSCPRSQPRTREGGLHPGSGCADAESGF